MSDSIVATAGQAGAIDPSLRVYLAPDARTNSLVVRSENPARTAQVRSMVEQLDVRTGSAANVHVIYLKNAEATRVAQTLRAILSGESSAAPAPAQAAGAQATAAQAAGAQGGGNQAAAQSRDQFRGHAEQGRQQMQGMDKSQLQSQVGAADRAGGQGGRAGGGAGGRPSAGTQDMGSRSGGASASTRQSGSGGGGFSGSGSGASTRAASSRGSASRGGGGGGGRGGGGRR